MEWGPQSEFSRLHTHLSHPAFEGMTQHKVPGEKIEEILTPRTLPPIVCQQCGHRRKEQRGLTWAAAGSMKGLWEKTK